MKPPKKPRAMTLLIGAIRPGTDDTIRFPFKQGEKDLTIELNQEALDCVTALAWFYECDLGPLMVADFRMLRRGFLVRELHIGACGAVKGLDAYMAALAEAAR